MVDEGRLTESPKGTELNGAETDDLGEISVVDSGGEAANPVESNAKSDAGEQWVKDSMSKSRLLSVE